MNRCDEEEVSSTHHVKPTQDQDYTKFPAQLNFRLIKDYFWEEMFRRNRDTVCEWYQYRVSRLTKLSAIVHQPIQIEIYRKVAVEAVVNSRKEVASNSIRDHGEKISRKAILYGIFAIILLYWSPFCTAWSSSDIIFPFNFSILVS